LVARPASVEEYLAALPEESQAALEKLRKMIRDAAPDATETISYQMPAFRDHDRLLVSYAAFKDHYSLFPMSLAVIDANLEELRPHLSGRATLRFDRERPPSASLVRKIVKARLAENAARRRARS
jgi:uncharacterized protein YdhG (YjbR/CyaY superfamily)